MVLLSPPFFVAEFALPLRDRAYLSSSRIIACRP